MKKNTSFKSSGSSEVVFYTKVGRRYVPTRYYDSEVMEAINEGATLIVKEAGMTMTRHRVDPEMTPVLAAVLVFREELLRGMLGDPKLTNKADSWSPAAEEKWKELSALIQDDRLSYTLGSLTECVDNAISTVVNRYLSAVNDYPTVKAAFDNFISVLKLTNARSNGS